MGCEMTTTDGRVWHMCKGNKTTISARADGHEGGERLGMYLKLRQKIGLQGFLEALC